MVTRAEQPLLGEVEQLVLLAVLRLGDDAYAVPIRSLILDEAGVDLSRGSVYVTLERLERKGYVISWFSNPQAVRGGQGTSSLCSQASRARRHQGRQTRDRIAWRKGPLWLTRSRGGHE